MRSTVTALQLLLFLFALAACSPTYKQPTVVHHSAPDLTISTDWVEDAGCPLKKYGSHYIGNCSSGSPLYKMGCDRIHARDLLGGLPYPLVTCSNYDLKPLGVDFTQGGCMLRSTSTFLTLRNNTYQFVGKEDIKAMSVPIDSADEALSYALATTDYYAAYDIEIDSYSTYLVDEIEDTFVEETQNGYIVHLFFIQGPECSCATRYTNSVTVLVYKNGYIKKINSHHVFKNDACVD